MHIEGIFRQDGLRLTDLAASWFFARSSPGLQRWLLNHRWLGPYLRAAEKGAMPRRAKVVSLVAMWTGIGLSSIALAGSPLVLGTVVAAGLVGTGFILFWLRESE